MGDFTHTTFGSSRKLDPEIAEANPNAKQLLGTDVRTLKDATGKDFGAELYAAYPLAQKGVIGFMLTHDRRYLCGQFDNQIDDPRSLVFQRQQWTIERRAQSSLLVRVDRCVREPRHQGVRLTGNGDGVNSRRLEGGLVTQ